MRISTLCLLLVGAAQMLVTRNVLAEDPEPLKLSETNLLLLQLPRQARQQIAINNDTGKNANVQCQRFDMSGAAGASSQDMVIDASTITNVTLSELFPGIDPANEPNPFQIHCSMNDRTPVTIAVYPKDNVTVHALDANNPPVDSMKQIRSGEVLFFVNTGTTQKAIECKGAVNFTETIPAKGAVQAKMPNESADRTECAVDNKPLLTAPAPTASQAPSKPEPRQNAEEQPCNEDAQVPDKDARTKLASEIACGETENGAKVLCVDIRAEAIGPLPELDNGDRVCVKLVAPNTTAHLYRLEVENKKNEFASVGSKLAKSLVTITRGVGFVVATQRQLTLIGPGTLEIRVSRKEGAPEGVDTCKLPEHEASALEVEVGGKTHFRAGVMIAYVGLVSRSFATDSDMRIVQEDRDGTDVVLTLSAYPFGVKDSIAVGFVLGTPFSAFGSRWLSGVTIESPYGFGIAAGAVLARVPELDNGLRQGQPFTESTIPTSNATEWTWFVGVNVDAALFARAFEAILPDSSSSTK